MKLTDILHGTCISLPLRATDKIGAITELVDLLAAQDALASRDDVLQAVLAREATRSTGIGLGLAVPHGKSHGVRRLSLAIGKPQTAMEFGSIDGRPCELIVLLASPVDKTGPHIQALASISRLWQNGAFRRAVLDAAVPEDLHGAIERFQA